MALPRKSCSSEHSKLRVVFVHTVRQKAYLLHQTQQHAVAASLILAFLPSFLRLHLVRFEQPAITVFRILQHQQEYTERSAALRAELDAASGELELLQQIKTELLKRGQESPHGLRVEICDAKNKIEGMVRKSEHAHDELKQPSLKRLEAVRKTLDVIKKAMGRAQ
jgi:hypothetical protein